MGSGNMTFTDRDFHMEDWVDPSDAGEQVQPVSRYVDEVHADLMNPVTATQVSLPWSKSLGKFAFRPGEVTLWAGSNGGGKSLITGQVALSLIQQKQSVCIASFEMKPKRSVYRMLRQYSGQNLDLIITNRAERLTGMLAEFKKFAGTNLWFFDQQGSTSAAMVLAMARYCATCLGVQHIFIDSLMKCVAGEDDYNGQKAFVDKITALARDLDVHIHLVHHIRKQGSEEGLPNKFDIKGTGAITDQVDNVLIMWRNKKKEHDQQANKTVDVHAPDAMLMCEKQRNGESEDWFNLFYHRDSQQFIEAPDGVPFDFRGDW
jgi:twinkle protein